MKHLVVVIPACNEARLIGRALRSVDAAASRIADAQVSVLVWANNCTDATAARVRAAMPRLGVPVHLVETSSARSQGSAGAARREAVAYAVATLHPDALLTTDADAELTPGTLTAALDRLRAGADLVCGSISCCLSHRVAAAPAIVRVDSISEAYIELVHELRFAIDLLYGVQAPGPRPHYMESGACIALRTSLHARLGGLPTVDVGEDRALVRAAERVGAQVRYCAEAHARVSARLRGRAMGGMAETIRRRLRQPDPQADEMAVPAAVMAAEWASALAATPEGRRPPLRRAAPPLRASDLERELSRATAFVESEVRPWLAARGCAGFVAPTRAVA